MHIQALLISALAGYVSATTYAQFCNDNACNDGCGESVSVDNPGCLNEAGRGSIKFHDSNIQDVRLVFSPEQNCNCQNECIGIVSCGEGVCGGPQCFDLSGHHEAQSFRFVGGSDCDANNC